MGTRFSEQGDSRPDSSTGLRGTGASFPESPGPSMSRRGCQTSSEKMSASPSSPIELQALDDNCARYVLSVMIAFLRQTAPPHQRLMSAANLNFNASYHDFESVEATEPPTALDHLAADGLPSSRPKALFELKHHSHTSLRSTDTPSISSGSGHLDPPNTYEKTSSVVSGSMLSLNSLIAKFAGKIVYHLSSSNWPVVFSRIRSKIYALASTSEDDPDIIDLQLLTHCSLDRSRLVQSLQGLFQFKGFYG